MKKKKHSTFTKKQPISLRREIASLEEKHQDQQFSIEVTSNIPDSNAYNLIIEQYNKWKISPHIAIH